MYRLYIRYLLTIAVCLLAINVLYLVAFQVTFWGVCIALSIATVVAFSYQNSNETHVPLAPHLGSFPLDGILWRGTNMRESLCSEYDYTATVKLPRRFRRPLAITDDKTEELDYSSLNSTGSRCYDPNPGSVFRGQERLRPLGIVCSKSSSKCITVQNTKCEQLNNKSSGVDFATDDLYLGCDYTSQCIVGVKKPLTFQTFPLPKFGSPGGSDNTTQELFPQAIQVSRSTANEIVSHPTHQSQFGSLGILPLVHLPAAPHAFSNIHSSRSLSHGLVTVKIAPPDPLIASVQFIRSENESTPPVGSKSCLNTVLNALTEKRKRNMQCDETLETGTSCYQPSNKRRKLDDSVESASSGSPPVIVSSCSGGVNLKRPALTDICAEMDCSKQRRLQPSAMSSSRSQPGASARNPVDASYTSSNRWLSHKAFNLDLKVASSVCQDISRRPPVETVPLSTFSQMMTSDEEEQHFPNSPCESSQAVLQLSSSRNSPLYASLDKGYLDDNSSNNLKISKGITKKDRLSYKANLSTSSLGKSEGYPLQSASYKAHLTIEDIDRDRQKEMERMNYMLGETSDLVQDAESGQPAPCAVSSPDSVSLPQAGTSALQPASTAPSVVSSLSPAVEHLSSCTTAPSVQQQTSTSATVVCSASSPTESTVPGYDLPSSLGSSPLHSQVLSAANPNPPVWWNSGSTSCQPFDSKSAASVAFISPEVTTFSSPTCCAGGSYGGFKFDLLASSKTSLSGFPANSLSVSDAVGGFRFESSRKSVSAIGSFKSSQGITAGDKVSEIASRETTGFLMPALTTSSVVSASTNLAAVFGFGQTTSAPSLSLNQPQTSKIASTSATSQTTADDSVIKSAASVPAEKGSAVQFKSVFTPVSQSVGNVSKAMPDQSLAISKMSSTDFLNISRNEASGGFENPSSTKTSFSGMFGCSVTNSNASKSLLEGNHSSALNSTPSSSVNPAAFGKPLDGNPVTGMIFNNKGFLTRIDEKNHAHVSAFDSQQALVSNSVLESLLKSSGNAGNQPTPEQGFGAFTTSETTQLTSGIILGNQPSWPFSFGSKPAVTNSFGIGRTTANLFDNQSAPVYSVQSTHVASLNSLGSSKTSLFPFSSPTSVNLPSNSEASVLPFNNPASAKSLSISQASLFSISNPTSINSLSNPGTSFSNPTSLNLIGSVPQTTGQFANQVNNSASGFGGLPSHSNVFGNPEQTFLNSCENQQMFPFNFGTPKTLENVLGNQTTSALSFGTHSAVANMLGNHVGDQMTQTGGFSSSIGLSAPSCVVEPKTLFSSPIFSQAQFPFPSTHSVGPNSSSVPNPTFQFLQNPETTSTVTSTQAPVAPNPFSFAPGFSHLPNNSPTMQQGQFPSQNDQFNPSQPQFASQMPWTPRFSIGTDNSNSARNRSSIKSRMRRKP